MQSARRSVVGALVVLVFVVLGSGPASAHTGFASSDPADGEVLDQSMDTITLVFTGAAEPTGDGFKLLDADGQLREPAGATTEDGSTWTLVFDPPVGVGLVGVRWTVKAPDAHAIDGSFSFTVNAPDSAPIGSQALPSAPTGPPPGHATTARGSAASVPPDDVAAAPAPAPGAVETAAEPTAGVETAAVDAGSDLAAFLDVEGNSNKVADRVGTAGRLLGLVGTLVGVGSLVFAGVVLRGDRRDVHHVLGWVRRAGLLAVVGAIAELVAQVTAESGGDWGAITTPSGIGAVIASTFGIAIVLRLIGGVALFSGVRPHITEAATTSDPVVAVKELVAVGTVSTGLSRSSRDAAHAFNRSQRSGAPYSHHGDEAWRPTPTSAGAVLGVAALLAAYLFDGHTVTKGDRLLTGIMDSVHVAGAAVWVGGVFMLTSVLWQRQRQGRQLRALQLAVRFSVVAGIALVVVGLAGVALTVIVLDGPSELWTTAWGRVLMAKILFVAVAAGAGGYNHKVLIPEMNNAPDDPGPVGSFLSVVSGEAAALVVVALLTAVLMGAAS